MASLLPFLIAGIVTGSVYGLAAVGLVLSYKTSGLFNFAHGAMATVSAYSFYSLYIVHRLPWQISAVICVLGVGPALGLALELLARATGRAALELRIAATIGILLCVEAVVTLVFGQKAKRTVPVFLPSGGFTAFDIRIEWADVATFLVAVAVTVVLSVLLRSTRTGIAMRAVVHNADLLDLAGTSPIRIRRWAWCLGAGLAALSGILFAPLLPLDPLQLTLLVVQAFGAAAIGRFSSLPWSFGGGLLIGVLASLATHYFSSGLLAAVPAALPFLALFVVLLVLPRRFLTERDPVPVRVRSTPPVRIAARAGGGVVVTAALASVPGFAGIQLTNWTVALAMTIVMLSLGMLVRTSGQVSLCHVAFMAIGASAFSHFVIDWHWPWPVAFLGCGLTVLPIGAVLSIPAIRLSGLYLALATFGFGVVLQVMFYSQDYMFGSGGLGLMMPRPKAFGLDSDRAFYWLVLVVTVVVTLALVVLNGTRLGRLLRGLADSPIALQTNGVATDITRVLVFCISAFVAALGGALAGMAQTRVSADSYQPLLSLTYFTLIVIVVGREPWYALVAAGALTVVPGYLSGAQTSLWLQVVFGALAVLVALAAGRVRAPAAIGRWIRRLFRGTRTVPMPLCENGSAVAVPDTALEVHDLSVRFGGVIAVEGLSMQVRTGCITGLIGPNGAGKTTTFDACSGLVDSSVGRLRLGDKTITRASISRRARLGLGRTFQRTELFDSLTVRENVAMGVEGPMAGANPITQLFAARGHDRRIRSATAAAVALCGIESIVDSRISELSTGQRRLVELARCLAGPYRILLLDEPSAGLDRAESERFGNVLRTVVAERGVGILLVEHDMSLVLELCTDVFVLDFGRLLFHGTPAELSTSEVVQHAYLGDGDLGAHPMSESVA